MLYGALCMQLVKHFINRITAPEILWLFGYSQFGSPDLWDLHHSGRQEKYQYCVQQSLG